MKKRDLDYIKYCQKNGFYTEAVDKVRRLLCVWPLHPELLLLYVELIPFCEDGPHYGKIVKELQTVLDLDSDNTKAHIALGDCYFAHNLCESEPLFDACCDQYNIAIDQAMNCWLEANLSKLEAYIHHDYDHQCTRDNINMIDTVMFNACSEDQYITYEDRFRDLKEQFEKKELEKENSLKKLEVVE